jgi:hypothetical protein
MMHVKFYAISVLFLMAVGACFLLIAIGNVPDRGMAADNTLPGGIDHTENLIQPTGHSTTSPGQVPPVETEREVNITAEKPVVH